MTEFITTDTSLPPYMVFPRFLLDMELNETTKLLYMVLLDRARLSLKNEGWTDESGHVFLYFTIESMAEVLHKSQMTIKTSLAALEKQDLIIRKRQGAGHPNRIYVKFPEKAFCQTDNILSVRQKTVRLTDRILSLRQTENCPVIRKREIRTIYQKERVRRNALPMENFKMYSCQKRNWKKSDSRFQTGRNISNGYPATWLPPENNTGIMQLLSSTGQGRTIPFPNKEFMKARNMKHYDKIYRRTKHLETKQTTSI